ncbi:MAG: hypothetical protein AABY45_05565 [Deltaproteobacteria bacterium]
MKKFIIGVLLGIVGLGIFMYLGGSKYVKALGSGTEKAGAKLERYEKQVQETAKDAKQAASKTVEKTKDKVKEYSR